MLRKLLQLHKLLGLKKAYNKTQRFLEEIASGLVILVILVKVGKRFSEAQEGWLSWLFAYEAITWEISILMSAMEIILKWTCFFFMTIIAVYYVRENWYLGSHSLSYKVSVIFLQVLLMIWNCFSSRFASCFNGSGSNEIIRYILLKVQLLNIYLKDSLGRHQNSMMSRNDNDTFSADYHQNVVVATSFTNALDGNGDSHRSTSRIVSRSQSQSHHSYHDQPFNERGSIHSFSLSNIPSPSPGNWGRRNREDDMCNATDHHHHHTTRGSFLNGNASGQCQDSRPGNFNWNSSSSHFNPTHSSERTTATNLRSPGFNKNMLLQTQNIFGCREAVSTPQEGNNIYARRSHTIAHNR